MCVPRKIKWCVISDLNNKKFRPKFEIMEEDDATRAAMKDKQKAPKKGNAKEQETEKFDASGLKPSDIELVMSQAHVSRKQAIKALRLAEGDIVEAILVRNAFISNTNILICT